MADGNAHQNEVPLIYQMIGRVQAEGASHAQIDGLAGIANGLDAIIHNPLRGNAMKETLETLLKQCQSALDLCTPFTRGERPGDKFNFEGFGSKPDN